MINKLYSRIPVSPTFCPVVRSVESAFVRYLVEVSIGQGGIGEVGTGDLIHNNGRVIGIRGDQVVAGSIYLVVQAVCFEVALAGIILEVLPHSGEDHVLNRSSRIRSLKIQAIRPACEDRVVDIQCRVATDMHGSLELSTLRTVGSIFRIIQDIAFRFAGRLAIERPIRVTLEKIGFVSGSLPEPFASLSDSKPLDLDVSATFGSRTPSRNCNLPL